MFDSGGYERTWRLGHVNWTALKSILVTCPHQKHFCVLQKCYEVFLIHRPNISKNKWYKNVTKRYKKMLTSHWSDEMTVLSVLSFWSLLWLTTAGSTSRISLARPVSVVVAGVCDWNDIHEFFKSQLLHMSLGKMSHMIFYSCVSMCSSV